ncbi:MAG TPA: cobaltochelatase subunit CobN, partial [Acetobacteraceae bacterium]|nr:cobaltochelatase subunit CobN [Acetobacteraceae bacterium]
MMPKRITPGSAAPVRVVVVTMDSHMAPALATAAAMIGGDNPGFALSLHCADEWGQGSTAPAECLADIAAADIVIATMLFLDDHIRAVLPALQARRNDCDAMLCALSAGEVVRLTRVGKFDMSAPASGMGALLKRLRGQRGGATNSGRGQLRMLKQLPRLLRFIPGTAQDMRVYFLALQYWLAGSPENFAALLRLLVTRYAAGARGAAGLPRVAPPIQYPEVGLYHPAVTPRLFAQRSALPHDGTAGTVGLLILRSYVLAGNAGHYDGVIAALHARGLNVVPAFASGLDAREAIECYFLRDGAPTVDAIVSLTGFSLVGGPAYSDAHAAEDMLARLDVPYVAAHPLEFQTLTQWEADARGLTPVEATMMVALPELDGATGPITFGGRAGGVGETRHLMAAHPERVAMLARRVARLIALRRARRADRKIAVVLFCFPPNAGNAGTAAYLAVFESLFNTLNALRDAGYTVTPPA